MTKLQDRRAWSKWLRDTRVNVSPQAASATSRTGPIPHGRGITRRGIRPQLSAINYQVLNLFAKSDILLPDLPSPITSAATVVTIPTPSLPQHPASHIDPPTPARRGSSRQSGKSRQARLFCSAFRPYSRGASIRRTRPAKSQRRAHPTNGRMSYLAAMTLDALVTYALAGPDHLISLEEEPLFPLTDKERIDDIANEAAGVLLSRDTRDGRHIFRRYDTMTNRDADTEYLVLANLGRGTYGQVFKCQDLISREIVAVKVAHRYNHSCEHGHDPFQVAFTQEKTLLKTLNAQDPNETSHIIRLKETFYFHGHGCLVFASGGPSLYDWLTARTYRGSSLDVVHNYAIQMLIAIDFMHDAGWVHTDLKPDNVEDPLRLWLIDFGCAERASSMTAGIKQSLWYRAPEALLCSATTAAIDIWSLGCIFAELYFGSPLFRGLNHYDQLELLDGFLGHIPAHMVKGATGAGKYFDHRGTWLTREQALKKAEQEHPGGIIWDRPLNWGVEGDNLSECIKIHASYKGNLEDRRHLNLFVDFLENLLAIDPAQRMTAKKALKHDFVRLHLSGEKWLLRRFGIARMERKFGKEWVKRALGQVDQTLASSMPSSALPGLTRSMPMVGDDNHRLSDTASLHTISSSATLPSRNIQPRYGQQQSAARNTRQPPVYSPRQLVRPAPVVGQSAGQGTNEHSLHEQHPLDPHLQVPSRHPDTVPRQSSTIEEEGARSPRLRRIRDLWRRR